MILLSIQVVDIFHYFYIIYMYITIKIMKMKKEINNKKREIII